MKKFLRILLSIFIIFVVVVGIGIFYLTRGLSEGEKLQLSGIDPTKVSDGTYNGKYEAKRWTNEVAVTVKDGKITDIKVVEDVTIPQPDLSQKVFMQVIEKQSTDIDIVSGATVTSKAYLKAIENALSE